MTTDNLTYEEIATRLRETEEMVNALYGNQVDAIVGKDQVALVRLREVEKQLFESNQVVARQLEEIEIIYQTAPVGLCAVDPELRVIRINKQLAVMFGIRAAGPVNVPFAGLAPNLAAALNGRMRQVAQSGIGMLDVEISSEAWEPGELPRYWLTQICPLHRNKDEVAGVHLVIEEITGRKRAEADLRKQNALLEERVGERTVELEAANLNLQRRADQLQKMTQDMSEIESRERRRITELLHDDIQQLLVCAKLHLATLKPGEGADAFSQKMALVQGVVTECIDKTRDLSRELNLPSLASTELSTALSNLAEEKRLKYGLEIHAQIQKGIDADAPLKAFLFKSAKEILFNIVKHAKVNKATLSARQAGGKIEIAISDLGRGFDVDLLQKQKAKLGVGLLHLQERVESMGGEFIMDSTPGRGSTFIITVPDR